MTQTQTETRCEKSDLLPRECAHCKGDAGADEELLAHRARLLRSVRWIAANYPGTCSGCGDWYSPGTAITRDGDSWRAECCEDTQ